MGRKHTVELRIVTRRRLASIFAPRLNPLSFDVCPSEEKRSLVAIITVTAATAVSTENMLAVRGMVVELGSSPYFICFPAAC